MTSWSRWRAALRIARREAWRHRGRSILVLVLLGLPVLVLAGADVAYRTWQLSPTERISREIGDATAGIEWYGGRVVQQPTAWLGTAYSASGNGTARVPSTAEVRDLLPDDARAIAWRQPQSPFYFRTTAGLAEEHLVGLDYMDPLARGMVEQVSGRAPRTDREIALTTTLAAATGVRVGDTVHALAPDRDYRVVGTVRETGNRDARTAYVLPAAIPSPAGGVGPPTTSGEFGWLVGSSGPISWSRVLSLNKNGLAVLSRAVFVDPPPSSRVPAAVRSDAGLSQPVISGAAVLVGMALLEVVLLAGPAFAVSARRRRRELALIAAVGGRRSDLRRVVLADGVVLGLAAGVLGIAGGIGLAAVLVPTLGRVLTSRVPGGFDVRPAELAVLVGVSLLTSIVAAALPARTAARTDVVAALAGRRGTVRSRRSVPIAGLIVAAFGVVVTLGGVTSVTATVLLAGVALIELGLIASTPALLGVLSRGAGRLPISGRIALRDAGRNRSAASPAVAAVMAAVIGAMTAALSIATTQAQERANYLPALARHDAWVALEPDQQQLAPSIAAAMRDALPGTTVRTVRIVADTCDRPEPRARSCAELTVPNRGSGGPPRFRGSAFGEFAIDDGSGVSALLGVSVPAAARALARGEAVVVDHTALATNGTITLRSVRHPMVGAMANFDRAVSAPRLARVRAVVVDSGYPAVAAVIPPPVARKLALGAATAGVLADLAAPPTDAQQQAINAGLAAIDPRLSLEVETGYQSSAGWLPATFVAAAALVAVLAALIATALANIEGSRDLTTLGAVGAAPSVRRRLSSARAALIAGIGTVIGTAAGFAPGLAWARAQGAPLVVPVAPVVAAVVGIPLAAAALAWLAVRARSPMPRTAG